MTTLKEVRVPDIGGAEGVDVIEILVKPGDTVAAEDSLITLESDKASMEIPSPFTGIIKEIKITIGDKISENDLILTMEVSEVSVGTSKKSAPPERSNSSQKPAEIKAALVLSVAELPKPIGEVHASPSVRRVAREFGVDLRKVGGRGPKGRILKTDVQNYVKVQLARAESGAMGLSIAPAPKIDFSKFGPVDIQPLNKIKKLTGVNVHRSWVTVPHVTQFGEADITEMESVRQAQKKLAEDRGVKLTPLVFIMKAVVSSLREFPIFNASLDASGDNLVFKKYFHLGVAVDTPSGLVVPVIRDVDKKDVFELAKELAEISLKARESGLTPAEMSGSTFTVSSLGGIGGTAFTPIVKAPDVAILGVSRSSMKPVYQDNQFVARLILPLSLSYDHRVVDGADGARFMVDLSQRLESIQSNLK